MGDQTGDSDPNQSEQNFVISEEDGWTNPTPSSLPQSSPSTTSKNQKDTNISSKKDMANFEDWLNDEDQSSGKGKKTLDVEDSEENKEAKKKKTVKATKKPKVQSDDWDNWGDEPTTGKTQDILQDEDWDSWENGSNSQKPVSKTSPPSTSNKSENKTEDGWDNWEF